MSDEIKGLRDSIDGIKCSREKYFSELPKEGQIQRLRETLVDVSTALKELSVAVEDLRRHQHNQHGDVVVQIHPPNPEQGYIVGRGIGWRLEK